MRRYYLNNKWAKRLLWRSYSTISLGLFVVSKEEHLRERTKVHETIHAMQWAEVTVASLLVLTMLSWLISPLWMMAAPVVYYVWYVVEWLLRLPHGNAYRNISFEREAYENEADIRYLVDRELFEWLKMI